MKQSHEIATPSGFPFRFSFFLISLLAFEVLDLEDHVRGDGAFLVEDGVGQGLFDDGADFPGDTERDLMDGLNRMVVKERLICTRQFEVVIDIGFGLFRGKAWHVITHGDPLVKGFHDGKLRDRLQVRLTGEDEDEGVVGVHLEVGQQAQFFEGAGLKKMSFVNDEKDGLSRTFFGFQESFLDLAIDGALGESGREPEEAIDVIQEIGAAQGREGCIVRFEKVLIQGVHVAPEGEGFPYPGVSGEKQDAAPAFDIIESGHGFLEGLRLEDILGLEVLIKRKTFETKPGEQVFHGRTSPL